MKKFLAMSLTLLSFQSFAFTSVTLLKETALSVDPVSHSLSFSASAGKGDDYCYVTITSKSEASSQSIPAQTVFEVTSVDQNGCDWDWGHQCRLDLSAHSESLNVSMSIMCKDKGLFSRELSPSKVNKIAKEIILVK